MIGKLTAHTIPISSVSISQIDEIFELYSKYYTSIDKDIFESDLKNKKKIIILMNEDNKICGFSTLTTFFISINHKRIKCLFSGDTVIEQKYWGTSALTLEFLKNIILEKCKNPFNELWWFLISKGYKTYLLMANNFTEYYPRYDLPTPKSKFDIIKKFSETLYPGILNHETGVLAFQCNHDKLKDLIAPITKSMCEKNPKINFFQKVNPNWSNGEELACIGKVSFSLAISHPYKILVKQFTRTKKRLSNA